MAITRRQFLKRTSIATAGAVVGPRLFRNPMLAQALADADNYLVVFYLEGGNDGLNTIVPADNGTVVMGGLRDLYQGARSANTAAGGIQLASGSLLVPTTPAPPMIDSNTGSQLGFHPGLQGIKDLYDQGHVAVVQGVGYPEPNLSHDESGRKWETGDPFGVLGTNGWVGRYLGANYGGTAIPGVNIRNNVAPEFIQGLTGVLAVRNVTDFSFPLPFVGAAEQAKMLDAFAAIQAEASASLTLPPYSYTGSTGALVQKATLAFPFLDGEYTSARPTYNAQYTALGTNAARDLREIAKVIYGVANNAHPGVVTSRFFEARQGGYDTHADQGIGNAGNQQFDLFDDLSQAIKLFYEDVSDMQPGLGDKITILVWSEFSRRISQNDSGTDHGSQGPMFLIGGGVKGGVVGNHPDIGSLNGDGNTIYSQDALDGSRSTDLRDVYGTVLRHWLNVTDPSPYLPPPDSGSAATYWTAPDFDLDLFLP